MVSKSECTAASKEWVVNSQDYITKESLEVFWPAKINMGDKE